MAYQPPKSKMFIALAGNIGCGKTTAAKLISRTFDLELFDEPVIDNRFLADYYKDMSRWSFTLQLEFLIWRTQHHELIARVPKSCIQDRTLYEDPVFLPSTCTAWVTWTTANWNCTLSILSV